LNQAHGKGPKKMATMETKEEYIKFDGNNEKKFQEWAIKTKQLEQERDGSRH